MSQTGVMQMLLVLIRPGELAANSYTQSPTQNDPPLRKELSISLMRASWQASAAGILPDVPGQPAAALREGYERDSKMQDIDSKACCMLHMLQSLG